ncbi:NADH:ubiquinone reductase (Na(+)-transporting) subunit D, partial [Plesiomonas shigelloides]
MDNNPIALHILGLCSSLRMPTTMETACIMPLDVTLVTPFSNSSISLTHNHLRTSVPIIVQMATHPALVIVAMQTQNASAHELSKPLRATV